MRVLRSECCLGDTLLAALTEIVAQESGTLHASHFISEATAATTADTSGGDSWDVDPAPVYTLEQFCAIFVDLFTNFDENWTAMAPSSVMEFSTIADAFRVGATKWAKGGALAADGARESRRLVRPSAVAEGGRAVVVGGLGLAGTMGKGAVHGVGSVGKGAVHGVGSMGKGAVQGVGSVGRKALGGVGSVGRLAQRRPSVFGGKKKKGE